MLTLIPATSRKKEYVSVLLSWWLGFLFLSLFFSSLGLGFVMNGFARWWTPNLPSLWKLSTNGRLLPHRLVNLALLVSSSPVCFSRGYSLLIYLEVTRDCFLSLSLFHTLTCFVSQTNYQFWILVAVKSVFGNSYLHCVVFTIADLILLPGKPALKERESYVFASASITCSLVTQCHRLSLSTYISWPAYIRRNLQLRPVSFRLQDPLDYDIKSIRGS